MACASLNDTTTLFLCGDVMTGRGVDQILSHPSDPVLYEPYIDSAEKYVTLAERANGPIGRGVDDDYIWGDSLEYLQRMAPDRRIVNLETSVTTHPDYWKHKGIHYRMHPDNVACLRRANIDCCCLANNHVMDWGRAGLVQTLEVLHGAGVYTAGAGTDRAAAQRPAVLENGAGRVLVFAFGTGSSGIPSQWAASERHPGVDFVDELSMAAARRVARRIAACKRPGDVVVASVHWGGNWGFAVSEAQRAFAHCLIDDGGADVVHGHSSHHVKGIEVYGERLVLYGCGDFINDYEGIGGYESYRGDLVSMYFPVLDKGSGRLVELTLVPLRVRRFRLERAGNEDAAWMRRTLQREGRAFGTTVEATEENLLRLRW